MAYEGIERVFHSEVEFRGRSPYPERTYNEREENDYQSGGKQSMTDPAWFSERIADFVEKHWIHEVRTSDYKKIVQEIDWAKSVGKEMDVDCATAQGMSHKKPKSSNHE
jgi:hypothetical protein